MKPQTDIRKAILKSIAFSGFYCVRTHMRHKETMAALLRSMEREGILEQMKREGSVIFYKKAPEKIIPAQETRKATALDDREIQQINLEGAIIRTFENAAETANSGYSPRAVAVSCQELKYYAGCRWRYTPLKLVKVKQKTGPKPGKPSVLRSKLRADNTSGVPGVRRNNSKCSGKPWTAVITIKGKNRAKRFDTQEEAVAQRLAWEEEHYVRRS